MKWAFLLLLALQVPIDAPLTRPDYRDAHERRRQAIEAMNAGVDLAERGEVRAALEALERAVELDRDYSRAHVNLGRMYIRVGRSEAAEAELMRAIELIELEQGRLESTAESGTVRALAELRASVHWDLGHLLFERLKRRPDANSYKREVFASRIVAALTEATILRTHPESPRPDFRAHHELGRVHDQLDQGLEADRSYRACIENQPDYAPCYTDLVRLYSDYGAFNSARGVIEAGLAVDSTSAELWLSSARLHLDRDRPKEAADDAKRAVTIDPDLADAYFVRGLALADLHERVPAIEALREYLRRASPTNDGRQTYAHRLLERLERPN